uniref:Ribose-5-phosphate isomerase A n=1 Tax=Candidatus Aschnera chinzeii TaxID=1485666 RepID=A0AAT9G4D3_9ENTR|nr:MAG: ribose-5-phosphate isomerase RpiA [Candidatus Aschnera chinzeii]
MINIMKNSKYVILQNDIKTMIASYALKYIKKDMIIGVGTGSTISYFIKQLVTLKDVIKGVVSSSCASTLKLQELSIPIFNSNQVDKVDIYIDSANEINENGIMIKGGGGALTQEKVIADMSEIFLAIVDESKYVKNLGKFPLPVEVIPMARTHVSRSIIKLGGLPEYRSNMITDNGNIIIDVYNLKIINPIILEQIINNIPGVVNVGLFAKNSADIILLGGKNGVQTLLKPYIKK